MQQTGNRKQQTYGYEVDLPLSLTEQQLVHQASRQQRERTRCEKCKGVEVAHMAPVLGNPPCTRRGHSLEAADQRESL